MPARLLELLLNRRRALIFLEWKEAQLRETTPPPCNLVAHGSYLLADAPSPLALWSAFEQALRAQQPLVVLGPMSEAARVILLRQLPEPPPPGAALVLFTSGSTGEPKAVFHSEESLLASAEQLATGLGAPVSQCSLLPAWGMAGIAFHFLLPLFSGKRLLWWNRQPMHELPPAIEAAKLDLLSLNPFLLEGVLRNETFGSRSLDVVSLTAPLTEGLRGRFRARCQGFLREIYGMTEAAGPVLLDGQSLGAQAKLEKDGALSLRGKQFLLGYGVEGKFVAAEGWFSTGDVFRREGTLLRFVARSRELIDCGGRKIAPGLVEEVFQLPELAQCLALAVEVQGVERVGLVYERDPGCQLSESELSQKIKERASTSLSSDMRPFVWRELPQIPRLANGKVSRIKARELLSGGL